MLFKFFCETILLFSFFNRYKRIVTQGHSCLVVAACWIVAIPLSFTPMLGWYNHQTLSNSANSTIVCQFIAVIPMSYLVYFSFFSLNLIPLLVMATLYTHVFCIIKGHLREKPGSSAQKLSQNYLRKEKKLAGSLALVFALFVLCWLPLHIMNCLVYFGEVTNIPPIVLYIGIILSHANSAVNPVVYAFKIQKIKRAYLKIWRKCVSRVAENQESQTSQMTDKRSSSHIVSNDWRQISVFSCLFVLIIRLIFFVVFFFWLYLWQSIRISIFFSLTCVLYSSITIKQSTFCDIWLVCFIVF